MLHPYHRADLSPGGTLQQEQDHQVSRHAIIVLLHRVDSGWYCAGNLRRNPDATGDVGFLAADIEAGATGAFCRVDHNGREGVPGQPVCYADYWTDSGETSGVGRTPGSAADAHVGLLLK